MAEIGSSPRTITARSSKGALPPLSQGLGAAFSGVLVEFAPHPYWAVYALVAVLAVLLLSAAGIGRGPRPLDPPNPNGAGGSGGSGGNRPGCPAGP